MIQPVPVPVFIISLQRSPRCGALRSALQQLGIPYEIVAAADVRKLTSTEIAALYDERRAIRRVGRPMGRGEIGCALSHRGVYQTMIERRIPLALILEEDAIPGSGFKALWQASNTLPANVDILILYSELGFVRRRAAASVAGCALHRVTAMLSGTVGYYIRQSTASALLQDNTPVSMVADWPLERLSVRQFLAVPMVLGHGETESIIAAERPTNNVLGRYSAPRWVSALVHLSFLGYALRPRCYEGAASYYRREVAPRVRRLISPGEIDVRKLLASRVGDGAEMTRSTLESRSLLSRLAARSRWPGIVNRLRSIGYSLQDWAAGRAGFRQQHPMSDRRPVDSPNPALTVGCLANWPDFNDALHYLTPGGSGRWGDVAFVPADQTPTDWIGVFNQPAQRQVDLQASPNRIFFAIGEPPTDFHRPLHLGQLAGSTVFTCDGRLVESHEGGRNYVLTAPMLRTWSVRRNFDQLRTTSVRDKSRRLSWITSDVALLPGHRNRLAFLGRLRRELDFDLYGRGFRRVYDKWDVLAPYRYSIAFENVRAPGYFTEKLMDCFVCETMPIYVGDPRIATRFPPESLIVIDPDATDVAEQIRAVVESDLWMRNRDAVLEAKRRVLHDYNVFAMLARFVSAQTGPAEPLVHTRISTVTLLPTAPGLPG
jgi:GR25 family glycosyltransferase involved in LPS biosynthesis